jgi:hypothetical protein
MKVFFVALALSLTPPTIARAEYSPRDFVTKAPARTFYTEDTMSESDKRAALHATFKRSNDSQCQSWAITEESSTSISLQVCPGSFVRVQLFHASSGDTIVAVESNRASGQAVDLNFFKVASQTEAISKLTKEQRDALGLEEVTENDLLTDQMKFPAGTAERLNLGLDQGGRPTALVLTWMNPRWEGKSQAFDIFFEWDGSRFRKQIKKRV